MSRKKMELLDLYKWAEQEGITVDCFALKSRESLSLMDGDGECFVAIDPMQLTSTRDEMVKLAHEVGHCTTGSFYNAYATCEIRQQKENRANKWAIGALIPKPEFEAAIAQGYTEPWELADYFGVTEPFVRMAMTWYRYGRLTA